MKTSYYTYDFDILWFFIKQSLWAVDLRSVSLKIHGFFYWYVFDKIFSESVFGGMKSHFGRKNCDAPIVLNMTVRKHEGGEKLIADKIKYEEGGYIYYGIAEAIIIYKSQTMYLHFR